MKKTQITGAGSVVYGVPGASAWDQVRLIGSAPGRSRVALRATCLVVCALSVVGLGFGLEPGRWVYGLVLAAALAALLRLRRSGSGIEEAIERMRSGGSPDGIPEKARSWAWGALAEERVGRRLEGLGREYQVAHDVRISGRRGVSANIDHLVSGPRCGLVMVDTKMWKGELTESEGAFDCDGTADERRIRARAVQTLRWEASRLPVAPTAIVVAVHGRGTVSGGLLRVGGRRQVPVVAMKDSEVPGFIRGLSVGRGPALSSVLAAKGLSLQA